MKAALAVSVASSWQQGGSMSRDAALAMASGRPGAVPSTPRWPRARHRARWRVRHDHGSRAVRGRLLLRIASCATAAVGVGSWKRPAGSQVRARSARGVGARENVRHCSTVLQCARSLQSVSSCVCADSLTRCRFECGDRCQNGARLTTCSPAACDGCLRWVALRRRRLTLSAADGPVARPLRPFETPLARQQSC